MKTKLVLWTVFCAISVSASFSSAQDTASPAVKHILKPNTDYKNTTDKDMFVLSDDAMTRILQYLTRYSVEMKRRELLELKLATYEARIAAADSATTLKKVEADFWHAKLLSTDDELKQVRIERSKWYNSRLLWFIVGSATAAVVIEARAHD